MICNEILAAYSMLNKLALIYIIIGGIGSHITRLEVGWMDIQYVIMTQNTLFLFLKLSFLALYETNSRDMGTSKKCFKDVTVL